jgi:hypothetical protein
LKFKAVYCLRLLMNQSIVMLHLQHKNAFCK